MKRIASVISRIEGISQGENAPLSAHTSWKVGGPADIFAHVSSEKAFSELVRITAENDISLVVIGNGSNILVSDAGFRGVVAKFVGELAAVSWDGTNANVGAGAMINSIVAEAAGAGLSGLEFAFGIPGTVGGAVMTNAGAFSGSISDVIARVRTVDSNLDQRIRRVEKSHYREPLVPTGEIVLDAFLELRADRKDAISRRLQEVRSMRRASQPWGMSTAGSVFKNPAGGHAGKLIDECGLKGRRIGGAKISEIHANFIINTGDATASDIMALISLARREVGARFGINLELEVQLLGFESEA